MYTSTYSTPLANGVTPDKLIKILHHHTTMLEALAPQKFRHEQRDLIDGCPAPPRGSIAEKFSTTTTTSALTTYKVTEPGAFGNSTFLVHITGRPDGCETLMCLPGGARILARWRVDEVEGLVEDVEVRAGCWNRRSARRRVEDHYPRQHNILMQLAATSKSITDSYPQSNAPED